MRKDFGYKTFITVFLTVCVSQIGFAQTAPDVVFVNGKVLTVDEAFSDTQAVAVSGNKIAAVGSTDEISELADVDTQVVDLEGRIIAFGEPFSTSGFLMPKAALASAGLRLVNYEDPAASIPGDRVGYVFSNDAENTMFWVLKQKVVAGAVNADYFEALAGDRISELRILLTTEAVPRNVVCARRDLDPKVVQAIEDLLLEMHLNDEGRASLEKFEETTRFDRFPGGSDQDLAHILTLLPHVQEDLGQ